MSTQPIPQLGPAMALAQLLQENPGLPPASWYIDQSAPTLHGHLHDATFGDLRAYADVLGGSIRPGDRYEFRGETLRSHRLTATWRDVHITIAVVLTASTTAVAA